jgi:hypothetical protein
MRQIFFHKNHIIVIITVLTKSNPIINGFYKFDCSESNARNCAFLFIILVEKNYIFIICKNGGAAIFFPIKMTIISFVHLIYYESSAKEYEGLSLTIGKKNAMFCKNGGCPKFFLLKVTRHLQNLNKMKELRLQI